MNEYEVLITLKDYGKVDDVLYGNTYEEAVKGIQTLDNGFYLVDEDYYKIIEVKEVNNERIK